MRIPSSVKHGWLATGETSLNFKVALTKCSILQTAQLGGHPVTKVRLYPRTGRRHQLRVHTAFLGHPIVGDHTYECRNVSKIDNIKEEASTIEASPPNLSPRMCLHAGTLGLPLPAATTTEVPQLCMSAPKESGKDSAALVGSSESPDTQGSFTTSGHDDNEHKLLQITAPDPFLISEDGAVVITPI
jgi:RNA pseudouridylate synthase